MDPLLLNISGFLKLISEGYIATTVAAREEATDLLDRLGDHVMAERNKANDGLRAALLDLPFVPQGLVWPDADVARATDVLLAELHRERSL